MISLTDLPAVNAALNALCAMLLCTGFVFIRRKNIAAHRACMISAVCVSVLFLISYLTYHIGHRTMTRFTGEGWVRPLYFSILLSHTILAAAILPMVVVTLTRALRERFDRHRRIARWTLPLWIYVSVTGVVVYIMLYEMGFGG